MDNKIDISNLDLSVIEGMPEQEKALVLQLLREFGSEGYSKTYEDLRYQDFEEIPVDIDTFLHDRKYLGNGLYDADGRFTLYPYWEDKLKEIFPDNVTTAYNTVVLTGAIGLGKSLVAVIILLYMLYRLLCLKDPYVYYGLQSIDKLTISFMNITLENAKGVALDKLNQFVLQSPWFMEHGEMAGKSNLVYRPQKHIELVAASSNNQIIGRCLFANFTDEINFSLTSNIIKAKEKAKKMITQIDARQRSRFLRGEYLPTINIIASSKDSEQSFLEDYIKTKKENESKTTLIVDEPQWVVDSRKDSPHKFWVGIGNKFLANELLPVDADDTLVDLYRAKGYNMLHVPIGYLETFQQNLDEAICSIAGIATASTLKFISGSKWNDIKTDSYRNPFTKEILEIGNGKDDLYQYSNFFDLSAVDRNNIGDPLFIHLDMSTSGDKTGISGVWICGKKQIKQLPTLLGEQHENLLNVTTNAASSNELQYKLAFHVAIKAPKGFQISFEKHRIFIRWLRDMGFNIKGITSDTFQSANLQQNLRADGFNAGILSVDRLDPQSKSQLQYNFFKNCIYEQALIIYKKCDLLTEEIAGLEKEADGHIQHPENGKFGCFTGDTLVSLTDGRKLSFLQLIDEQNQGKQNYVYSMNLKDKKIESKPIKKVWLTYKNQPLVKITLDDGSEIKCTLNHRFMLRNGSYIEAQDLIPGDSLMPLYTKYPENGPLTEYRMICSPFEDMSYELLNHSILKIEFLDEKQDVYDLEVPDNHNFALGCGIFVHNSKDCADAVCGALWNASQFAEEYEYSFGQKEALEQTLLLNGDGYSDEAQQLTLDLEEELKRLGPVLNSKRQVTHPSNVVNSTDNYTLLGYDDIIIL